MRLCPDCGSRYTDRVDFCFVDGSVLDVVEEEAAGFSELDVPLPSRFGEMVASTPNAQSQDNAPSFLAGNGLDLANPLAIEPVPDLGPIEAGEPPVREDLPPFVFDIPLPPPPVEGLRAPAQEVWDDSIRPVAFEDEKETEEAAFFAGASPEGDGRPVKDGDRGAPMWLWPAALAAVVALLVVVVGGAVFVGAIGGRGQEPVVQAQAAPPPAAPIPPAPAPPPPEPVDSPADTDAAPAVPPEPPGTPEPAPQSAPSGTGAPPAAAIPAAPVPASPGTAQPAPEPAPGGSQPTRVEPPAVPAPSPGTAAGSPWGTTAPAAVRASVRVVSTPPGARVSVDGTPQGTAPSVVEVDRGSHTFVFELDGYERVQRTLDVQSDLTVPADLAPKQAATRVRVLVTFPSREGDLLYVDGQAKGNLPQMVDLAVGPHRFDVEGEGGKSSVTRVVEAPSGATFLQLDLSK
jgi:hypothetical protein